MAKRSASNDLNHENWDNEDVKEEAGTFNRVSGDVLKQRIIRKAKRSLNSNSSGNSASPGQSPFAAFSGFAAASSPFSFSKKSDTPKTETSAIHSNTLISTKSENGNSRDSQASLPENIGNNSNSSSASSKPTRSIEYYRQLQSLNESILKWMQLHLSKNSCCDFTPVFNDYKKHLDTLNLTYPVLRKETEDIEDGCSKTSTCSNVSIPQSDKIVTSEANNSEPSKDNNKKDETDYGVNFSARPTNTSTFSFGFKTTGTATSSVSPSGPTSSSKEEEKNEKPFQFQFGNKSSTENSGISSGFSFGSKSTTENTGMSSGFSFGLKTTVENSGAAKGFSFAAAIAAKNAEPEKTEDENYEPPKNEFVAVTEEDAIYSKKCKLFFKKGDTFADKGVGMLYLKNIDGKTQLLVRADTSLGNILLNIMLSASLPMSRTGKNNVLLVCVPNPPIDAKNPDSKEAIPMLIRVKTAEDADQLLEVLNKHKS